MTGLSFEKALADLEGIVQKLEKGGISLNESLALFEKGVKLTKYLREELSKAEKKVEILLKDDQGVRKDEKGEALKEPFNLDQEVGFSSEEEVEAEEDDEGKEDDEAEEEEPPF
jgi:exodeoxyribonuclease VII small subunit